MIALKKLTFYLMWQHNYFFACVVPTYYWILNKIQKNWKARIKRISAKNSIIFLLYCIVDMYEKVLSVAVSHTRTHRHEQNNCALLFIQTSTIFLRHKIQISISLLFRHTCICMYIVCTRILCQRLLQNTYYISTYINYLRSNC